MMTMVPSASVDGRVAVPDAAHGAPRADSRSRPRGAPGAGGDRVAAAVLLAPNVIGFSLFLGVPIGTSLVLSLFDADGFGAYDFVGLANYGRMLGDPLFGRSEEHTSELQSRGQLVCRVLPEKKKRQGRQGSGP